ncbi:helix-turn-helix transcriptional regulator [Pandoraea sp. NPDC090278]|uniref:helix-turn-helix transcriptional regulator n=1 Tax=Pandoraea sp. NPDC090278 TaxID=3364391 RepID=UPI00383A3248
MPLTTTRIFRATVYRLINAEKLKLVKIGTRSSGITAASIEALLAGNAACPISPNACVRPLPC